MTLKKSTLEAFSCFLLKTLSPPFVNEKPAVFDKMTMKHAVVILFLLCKYECAKMKPLKLSAYCSFQALRLPLEHHNGNYLVFLSMRWLILSDGRRQCLWCEKNLKKQNYKKKKQCFIVIWKRYANIRNQWFHFG